MYRDSRNVRSIINVLLSMDHTVNWGVMVKGHEHTVEEKACQYSTLGGVNVRGRKVNVY
jgi:hypothetical protein